MDLCEDNSVVKSFEIPPLKDIKFIEMTGRDLGRNACHFVKEFSNHKRDVKYTHIHIKNFLSAVRIHYMLPALEDTPVKHLQLSNIGDWGAICLAQALTKTNVLTSLNICDCGIGSEGIKNVASVLKDTRLSCLDISHNNIGDEGMKHLAEGLKNSNVLTLWIMKCGITFEGVRFFADILHHINVTKLQMVGNEFGDEGVTYLAERLKNSMITQLGIGFIGMGNTGIRNLVAGLRNSSITELHIWGKIMIHSDDGFRFLVGSLHETQISELRYGGPDYTISNNVSLICKQIILTKIQTILTLNTEAGSKLVKLFQKLVGKNILTHDLEFMIPTEKENLNIDEYFYLIKTINSSPVINGHLLKFILRCRSDTLPALIMKKINIFMKKLSDKFNAFINNNITHFIELCSFNDFINLIKEFEENNFEDIVQNFLLHRALFFVDENGEVLHPYIYQLLDKYKMPLYNDLLEPYKKGYIISYFNENKDIEGAEEIINLLSSDSN